MMIHMTPAEWAETLPFAEEAEFPFAEEVRGPYPIVVTGTVALGMTASAPFCGTVINRCDGPPTIYSSRPY